MKRGQVPTEVQGRRTIPIHAQNDPGNDERDTLSFKWLQGAETTTAELGSPTMPRVFTLCACRFERRDGAFPHQIGRRPV